VSDAASRPGQRRNQRPSRRAAHRHHQRGAIPKTTQFQVIAEPEGTLVGTLDEDFAIESQRAIFSCWARTSWRISASENAASAWRMPRPAAFDSLLERRSPRPTIELSREVARLREDIYAEAVSQPQPNRHA